MMDFVYPLPVFFTQIEKSDQVTYTKQKPKIRLSTGS